MALFTASDAAFVDCISEVAYCNPFRPERISIERRALGASFDERHADWNVKAGGEMAHPNVEAIIARCRAVIDRCSKLMADGQKPTSHDLGAFEDLLLFTVYHEHRVELDRAIAKDKASMGAVYRAMARDVRRDAAHWSRLAEIEHELPHLFAGFVQTRRAFYNIFEFIVGCSRPAIALRAAVWESIFTHDLRRYRKVMFRHLGDYATLITGPSGTGKELVARAVGLSRYIPFNPKTTPSTGDDGDDFFPVSLAAMSPTLVESELFGHVRGAFTGAIADRKGWLETCSQQGTVFLDEIGELDTALQVKLLRVLQSREFSRLGETKTRRFHGKIIAATNRNLADEMHHKRFREDLFYRLCSDMVEVPSLAERIADHPGELHELVDHVVRSIVGPDAEDVVADVEQAIEIQLGPRYAWPGNVRELEQCVRNLLVRKRYVPPRQSTVSADPFEQLAGEMRVGNLTADQLLTRYCQLDYAQSGSYEATARRLGLDRRTVKARVVALGLQSGS